jgi:hypothetical protein
MDGLGNGWQRMGWTGYSDDTTLIEAGWIHLTDCSQNCLPGTARPSSRLTALVSPIRTFNRPTTFLWTSLRGSCSPFFRDSCFPFFFDALRLVFLDFLLVTASGLVFPTFSSQPGTRVSLFRFFGTPFSSRLRHVLHFLLPCAFGTRVSRFGFSSLLRGARVPHSAFWTRLFWDSCFPPIAFTPSRLVILDFLLVTASGVVFPIIFAPRDSPSNFLWGPCSPSFILHALGLIFLALDSSFLGLVFPTL